MILSRLKVGPIQTNCYVVKSDTSDAGFIVDPGASADKILEEADKLGVTLEELQAMENPQVHALLEQADYLVDGPFLLEQRDIELNFRGSANQRVLDLPKSLAAGEAVLWDAPAYI